MKTVYAYFVTNGKHGRNSLIDLEELSYSQVLIWYLYSYKEIKNANTNRIKEESVWFLKQNKPHYEVNGIQQYILKVKERDREDLTLWLSDTEFTDVQLMSFYLTGEDLLKK